MARAIWKGELVLGKVRLPVKMYSAVEDRKVHFHLLDAKHHKKVHQRIVRKSDGREVGRDEQRKALPIDSHTAVILRPEELEEVQPEASRDIEISSFIPRSSLSSQWFERPYYLGPDRASKDYFALARELEREGLLGIGRWVMRGKSYAGALVPLDGYLGMVTLRRAEQIVSVASLDIPASHRPDAKEVRMAEQLVDAIAGELDPSQWQDEYHDRVCRLIARKAKGKAVHLPKPKAKRAPSNLEETLRRSLEGLEERKVA